MENSVGQPQNIQVPNYSGVNIQIFNPSVNATGAPSQPATITSNNYSTSPVYPQSYYTQNFAQPQAQSVVTSSSKKTEKREVVELTDDYIKSLENYLNCKDKEVRMIAAKDVLARFQEDTSRRDDVALNALINKMLQDPYQPIRFIAMGALESKAANGNSKSVTLLQKIENEKEKDSEDSLKASNALLRMMSTTSEKEFEVKGKK